jgi:hypothetical protein
LLTPPAVAFSVAVISADTTFVVTANWALVAPLGTVTFVGTVAASALELDRVTTVPATGAALFRVTVPVTAVWEPPITGV